MRPFVVTYRGRSMTVDPGGYYFNDCYEGIRVGDDMAVSDVVLQSLKDEHAGEVDQAASTSASSAPSTSAVSASSTSKSRRHFSWSSSSRDR
jgi:hypothetical protein